MLLSQHLRGLVKPARMRGEDGVESQGLTSNSIINGISSNNNNKENNNSKREHAAASASCTTVAPTRSSEFRGDFSAAALRQIDAGVAMCHVWAISLVWLVCLLGPLMRTGWVEGVISIPFQLVLDDHSPWLATKLATRGADVARPALDSNAKNSGFSVSKKDSSRNNHGNNSNSNSNSNGSKNNENNSVAPGLANTTTPKRFICNDEGRVLPIILGGIRKSGSTTFWNDVKPAVWPASPRPGTKAGFSKEPQFFGHGDSDYRYDSLWGKCSDPQPGVALDFSTSTFIARLATDKIKREYKQKSKEVIFLFGLREPVNRIVSNYYFNAYRQEHSDVNFPEDIEKFFRMWSESLGSSCEQLSCLSNQNLDQNAVVATSFYYRHLRNFLDSGFLASQMVVFPGLVYLKHRDNFDTNPVLQALRARIGQSTFRLNHTWRNEKVYNKGPAKEIYGDNATLVDAARSRLQNEVFAVENKRLFKFLAEQVDKGMTLVGYTGKANDVEAVEKWLTSGWQY